MIATDARVLDRTARQQQWRLVPQHLGLGLGLGLGSGLGLGFKGGVGVRARVRVWGRARVETACAGLHGVLWRGLGLSDTWLG